MSESGDCGWVKLWHRRGVQVTIPLRGDITTFSDQIEVLFAGGWLAQAPGLEAGEERGECGWVVRSRKDGRDGEVDVLDLYLPDDKFPKVRVYLNTADDVAAFEAASRMKVGQLPVYVGTNKVERGASRQADQFVAKAPVPFGFVWKPNPKYNPDEKDAKLKKPARVFVRWDGPTAPKQEPAADPGAAVEDDPWERWLTSTVKDDLDTLNGALHDLKQMDAAEKERVWRLFGQHALARGWRYDREAKRFAKPPT